VKSGIFNYAWDLVDEGYDQALGRIAESGFNAINLACAYHAGKFLLPHNPKRRVYFPEDGALYFQPDSSRYGRIQPRVSTLARGESDPLRDLDRERRKYGLDLVAWTVCLHNSWIGERYPDCAMHTAFGDPLIHSLSPAHPDVHEYMTALVSDIVSIADVSAIQLESPDYMGYDHGYHHEVTPVPLGDPEIQRDLLALSFNPVEIERAGREGIDAERLRTQVANALDSIWNSEEDPSPVVDQLLENPDFDRYRQFLHSLNAELLERSRRAIKGASPNVEIRLFAGMASSESIQSLPRHIVDNADGLLSGYVPSDEATGERASALKAQSDGKPVFGMVRAIMPDTVRPPDAARRVAAWKDAGVDGIDVYNYGFMTLPTLKAVSDELKR
jgi:hypothetical protein